LDHTAPMRDTTGGDGAGLLDVRPLPCPISFAPASATSKAFAAGFIRSGYSFASIRAARQDIPNKCVRNCVTSVITRESPMGRRVRSAWCNVCRDALRCRGQRSSRAFARAPDLPGFFGQSKLESCRSGGGPSSQGEGPSLPRLTGRRRECASILKWHTTRSALRGNCGSGTQKPCLAPGSRNRVLPARQRCEQRRHAQPLVEGGASGS
jgi:hypothetical protein